MLGSGSSPVFEIDVVEAWTEGPGPVIEGWRGVAWLGPGTCNSMSVPKQYHMLEHSNTALEILISIRYLHTVLAHV